jgi:DoxX-like family
LMADALGWLGWRSPLRSNSIAALVHGVRGKADEAVQMLGREPLSLPQMLGSMGAAGKADRWHARFGPVYPLALAMLVALWLGSAVLGVLRLDQAAAELTMAGPIGAGLAYGPARALVLAGSLADLAIALGIVFRPTLARALQAGITLSLAYVAGALVLRPDLWLDPLGPMLKVLPIVALMLACLASSEER